MEDDPESARLSEALPTENLYVVPNPRVVPRPFSARAKLRRHGAHALTNTELLAVLLGDLQGAAAGELLRGRGFKGLATVPDEAILKVRRLGPSHRDRLRAAYELHRRLSGPGTGERQKLMRPADVYGHVAELRHARKEHLLGLYLDAQNGLIHRETLSIGSLNTTRTHPREILYPAIEHLALGFILAHNHPSGCLDPSEEDVEFTRGVKRAGEVMGIELYDHLIVAGDGYTSLRERGAL